MPFDADLVLVDGTVDLIPTTDTAPTSTTRDTDTGAVVIDLGGTTRDLGDTMGIKHLVAVLNLPSVPTTYADTLAVNIQQSDAITFGWQTIASFQTLYAYTRVLTVVTTTAFLYTDINETLTGTTTADSGVMRWFDNSLLTLGGTGKIIVMMEAADDLFDNATEAFTTSGTGAGTLTAVGAVEDRPMLGGANTFTRAFAVTKRYVRGELTVSTSGNFGAVQLMLSPYPFQKL